MQKRNKKKLRSGFTKCLYNFFSPYSILTTHHVVSVPFQKSLFVEQFEIVTSVMLLLLLSFYLFVRSEVEDAQFKKNFQVKKKQLHHVLLQNLCKQPLYKYFF